MSDSNIAVDLTKPVDYTCPDGFMEAAAALDFLPDEEARVGLLTAFINNISLL